MLLFIEIRGCPMKNIKGGNIVGHGSSGGGRNWLVVRDQIYQPLFGSTCDSHASFWTAKQEDIGDFCCCCYFACSFAKEDKWIWMEQQSLWKYLLWISGIQQTRMFVCSFDVDFLLLYSQWSQGERDKIAMKSNRQVKTNEVVSGIVVQYWFPCSLFVCFDPLHLKTQAAATMVSGCVSLQLAIPWKPPVHSRPGRAWLYCPSL